MEWSGVGGGGQELGGGQKYRKAGRQGNQVRAEGPGCADTVRVELLKGEGSGSLWSKKYITKLKSMQCRSSRR